MTDLEIWLIGDPAAVDRVCHALTATGRVSQTSTTTPMGGTDAGRVRRYLRLHPPMTTRTPTQRSAPGSASLLDDGSDR